MRVILDLEESVLNKLEELATIEKRSRKNYMEFILENAAGNTLVKQFFEKNSESISQIVNQPLSGDEDVSEVDNSEIEKQISLIKAEKKPSFIPKTSWDKRQKQKISQLEKQLKP